MVARFVLVSMIFLSACTTRFPQIHLNGPLQEGRAISYGQYKTVKALDQYIKESYEYVYLTKDNTKLVTASSLYLVPYDAKNQIVVFAHPTTGIYASCGIDNGLYQWAISRFISALLKQKYIVIVPNYRGLGISNTQHKFLNANEAAMDILDAIRSAISLFKLSPDIPIVLWGYSQGGQATQRASEIASKYSPKLNIIGSIQNSAPLLLSSAWSDFLSRKINLFHYIALPYVLSGIVKSNIGVKVNDFSSEYIFNDNNLNVCAMTSPLLLVFSNPFVSFDKVSKDTLLKIYKYLQQQDIGHGTTKIPLLVIRGQSDKIVKPEWQVRSVDLLCSQKMEVLEIVREGNHIDVKDIPIALKWIKDRFSFKPAPNICTHRQNF